MKIAFVVLTLFVRPAFALCIAPPPPQIVITTGEAPAAFDLTHTDRELTAEMQAHGDAGWVQSDRPDIKGMLQDRFLLGHALRFDTHADPQTGATCLAIGQIAVSLRLQAKIYVAKGYNRDEEYFRRIFTHENDRLAADRTLLSDYAPRLRDGMQLAFSRPADYSLASRAPDKDKAALDSAVTDSLNVLFRQILDARAREQRQIDVGR